MRKEINTMLKANIKALKNKLPKETKAFSSTCACGICSGGSGNCKGCQDKNVDMSNVKDVYSK